MLKDLQEQNVENNLNGQNIDPKLDIFIKLKLIRGDTMNTLELYQGLKTNNKKSDLNEETNR